MSRNNGQATKRKDPSKKGPKRQNNSSNAPQARAKRGQVRATKSNQISAAYGNTVTSKNATVSKRLNSWVISHQEMIGTLNVTNSGGNYSFQNLMRLRCNPGSQVTFPWLSNLATSFENYRFRRLRFYVITRLSSQDRGTVVISPDYDSADGAAAPVEAWYFSNPDTVDSPVWKPEVCLRLDPSKMNQRYKTHAIMSDTRFTTTVQDEKTIDVAQVNVASDLTYTTSNNGMIGKFMVDYEVELLIPQQPTEFNAVGASIGPMSGAGQLSSQFQKIFNGNLVANGAAITQDVNNPIIQFDPNKFTNGVILTAGPTPVVGQFLRDFSGLFNAEMRDNYSALWSGPGTLAVSQDAGNTVSVGDAAQQFINQLSSITNNAAGTVTYISDVYKLAAKAGDVLKFIPTTNGPTVITPTLTMAFSQVSNLLDIGLV